MHSIPFLVYRICRLTYLLNPDLLFLRYLHIKCLALLLHFYNDKGQEFLNELKGLRS